MLACLSVTQKIRFRFHLESKAAPGAAELTLVVSGVLRLAYIYVVDSSRTRDGLPRRKA